MMIEPPLWIYAAIGLLIAHGGAIRRRDRSLLAILLTLDAVAAMLALTAWQAPSRFHDWMQEDAWAEWGTFFAFIFAGALGLRAVLRSEPADGLGRLSGLRRLAYLGVALFCIFVAGEEISWGQRLFGFRPPEIFLQHNFQQELNVHNFLKDMQLGQLKLDSRYLVVLVALVYGLAFPWLVRVRRLREWGAARAMAPAAPALALTPWFALVAASELAYPIKLAGEACELMLGLVFLVDAVLRHRRQAPARSGPLALGAVALTAALAMLAPPLLQRVIYGEDRQAVAQATRELMQLQSDLERSSVITPRLRRRRRVHKRIFTAVRARYLDFGRRSSFLERRATPAVDGARDPRRDRRGYFLDPWNNPYWIFKDRGSVTLYSFGPNRRRDVRPARIRAGAHFSGDDVVRRFRL